MEETTKRRFFAASVAGEVVELDPAEAHHALGVLRLRAGEEVEVFDGAGAAVVGVLEQPGKGRASVRVTRRLPSRPRPAPQVELAFAVPKGKRLDWLLEKATELGAARLAPVAFARSVAEPELSEHARARWRGICVAAAKQCGTDFLPEIAAPRKLADYLAAMRAATVGGILLLGSPAGGGIPAAMKAWTPSRSVVVVVGPEGGITEEETGAAISAGFVPVRLGHTVLRVETAALALLAAVSCLAGFE